MQEKVFVECTVTSHIYMNKTSRELIEEDVLQSIIRQHGKLVSMNWSDVFVDGYEMHKLSAVYLEQWHE